MKKSALLIATGGIAIATLMASCGKDDEETKLPPIGGYNSSNEVAATNLKAHWTFDGTANEDISGTAPSKTQGVTYVTGVKGQAGKFSEGLLAYPTMTSLNILPSFTVTSWVQVANNKGGYESTSPIFSLARPATGGVEEWAGSVNLLFETGQFPSTSDTLRPKVLFVANVAGSPSFQDNINDPTKGGDQVVSGQNKWIFTVARWDGATSRLTVWVDGKKVSNPEWEERKDGDGNGLGNLTFFTPGRPVIGGYATTAWTTPEAWQKAFNGQIDELRVYDKALTEAEMTALMQLEQAGR